MIDIGKEPSLQLIQALEFIVRLPEHLRHFFQPDPGAQFASADAVHNKRAEGGNDDNGRQEKEVVEHVLPPPRWHAEKAGDGITRPDHGIQENVVLERKREF